MLRSIDRFVDLSELRRELSAFYSPIGRPSIAPELMIRMLLVGYCCGIRSERRLCEEVHLNLAYRWFCGLGLDGDVPDHSTFSKNRHGRFRESDLLRRLFEAILRRCIDQGLVGGESFAVDASLIRADANRQNGVEGEKGLAPEATGRAIDEYLAVLDDAAFGSGSRTRGEVAYKLEPVGQHEATRVDISVDYNLQGSLAQFSRSNLAQEFARQLVARFAANCGALLSGNPPAKPSNDSLRVANFLWLAVTAALKRMAGRS
jgi:transposase